MKLQVYRTNASSYQDSQFLNREKRILEEIEGVKYIQSIKEIDKNLPFALITNTKTNPQELASNITERTVLMIHPNSGFDNIPLDFVKNSPFPIVLGNPIRANAVVEYMLGCIFREYVQIPHHRHWSESRKWDRKLLRDQEVLIMGYGHIGKLVYQALRPLCRSVKVYDPFVKDASNPDLTSNWDESIFDKVSILLLAASLNATSYHVINHNVLKRLNQENIIINAARGELIKEVDLVEYMQKNSKSTAYLDVFEQEPFKPGHLNEITKLTKTSHIAGVYDRLNHDIISFEYLILKDFMDHFQKNEMKSFNEEYKECLLTEQGYIQNEQSY